MKHTPGPWQAVKWDDNADDVVGWSVVDSEGAMLPESEMTGDIEEAEANARLIAAAPDLLEALKICIEVLEDSGNYPWTLEDVKEAVAKATGEQQ